MSHEFEQIPEARKRDSVLRSLLGVGIVMTVLAGSSDILAVNENPATAAMVDTPPPPATPNIAIPSTTPNPALQPNSHTHHRVAETYPLRHSLTANFASPETQPPDITPSHEPKNRSIEPSTSDLRAHGHPATAAIRREGISDWIRQVPLLDQLATQFPKSFKNVAEEEAYINQLDSEVQVSPNDYKNLKMNTQYEDAFISQPNYRLSIDPRMFVIHWTAVDYSGGVKEFINVMRKEGLRVEFFIDRTGTIYKLFDSDNRYPAHALGVNSFTQGVEIEAKNMFDYTSAQLESATLLATKFCRENGLGVNHTTILGHYAVDLLYDNPTYDKTTGSFHKAQGKKPYLGKIDPPEETINFMVRDATELNQKIESN